MIPVPRNRPNDAKPRPLRQSPPVRPYPIPRRREICELLGLSVTICIAAKASFGDIIVTVSDRSLSHGDLVPASDDTLKAYQLWNSWGLLYSANDIGPVPGIVSAVRTELHPVRENLTVEVVREAFRKAWRKSATERAADRYLARLGFSSIEHFRQIGFHELGEAEFARLSQKIETFDPEISFLVYGFDQDVAHQAHIFEVNTPNDGRDLITDDDIQGFGVIGSGLWPALGVLKSRSVGGLHEADEVAYALCEAKFAAESASGVGKATTIMAFSRSGKNVQFTPAEIEQIRGIWEETRKQIVPDDASTLLLNKLNKLISDEDP
jgi:hypothetical protein